MAQYTNLDEMKWSCMWYPHASEMLTLTHNGANRVFVKITIIFNIIHRINSSNNKTPNARLLALRRDTSLSQELHYCSLHHIFNLRDTEVVID